MFRQAFKKLEPGEFLPIIAEINPLLDVSPFTGDGLVVLTQDLPFYPGYRFIEVADHAITPQKLQCAIYKPGDVTVLNWTNEPIYALNARLPLKLTDDTASLYVKFFFTYVRGRHGRFLICEGVDDIAWKEDPPPAARKAVGRLLSPVHIDSRDKDGTLTLKACMVFKDSLFRSSVHLKTDGSVSLSNEELLVEDMPVQDDTIGL